ncbi:ABC transporter ATP-binding protein [Nakamurella deserti]|uniref:ABC transporter ATP-binding protein n=1 Tax=Nakamurella deserti TaxID=2164074 RepID=UPI000DBE6106|nr:ABC transporter ATP-binding protein [Nakamurella deserti]
MSTDQSTAPPDSVTPPRPAGVTPVLPAAPTSRASITRLWPFVRPELRQLVLSAVLALAAMVCGLVLPLVVQRIVDGPIADRDLSGLWWPGALLLLAGIGEALLFGLRRWVAARPATRIQAAMRQRIYDRLQALPVAYHDGIGSGQLLSRAVSDLSTIRMFLSFGAIFLVVNSLTFLIGLGILFSLSWLLALVVLAQAIPLIVICARYETHYKVLARRSQDQVGDVATTVEESILGVRILKSFGRSAHLGREFFRQASELRATEIGKARMIAKLWATIIALPEIALGVCLLLGVQQVADGAMSAGTLVAFFTVAMILRWPIDSLGWLLSLLNDAASASERYFEVLDEPVTITSPANPVRLPADAGAGELVFEDVRFHFPDAADRPDVLAGIDLHLRPGTTVAVVGATGSGKTALTALVNRMYDVTGGRVLLDGVDVRDLDLADLRRAVSVAFEEPILFSASVAENITLGRPDSTEDEIRRAVAVAQADFVYDLPWGLRTRVGEQGLTLSGGQRQRLALARAVIGNPRVLVLDDPLSALDIHTEAAVERALRSVLHSTTALIIAHRASTVMMADQVALLQHGRIAAIGTHQELLARVPAYRALLSSAPADDPDTDPPTRDRVTEKSLR